MQRLTRRLTHNLLASYKPRDLDYKVTDGLGLRLLIKKNGKKYWRFEYRFHDNQKSISFGEFPSISLADARRKCDEARLLIQDGSDPSTKRKEAKNASHDAVANSFKAVSLDWFKTRGKKSESGDKRIKRLLERDLFPYLANRPIKDITPSELLKALEKIQDRGAVETARRAKQYVSQIYQYAFSKEIVDRDITANLKKALKTPVKTHFSAITNPKELGRLMIAIKHFRGTLVVKSALELSALLVCRPGELRHMEWNEVNWDEKRIELPAHKMKMKEPHIIPLSTRAFAILTELKLLTGSGKYIFPSARGDGRPMSENAVRVALRTLGFTNDEMTAHGFRATARTILDEVLEFPVHLIEHQLAHAVKDANGRAYNRTKHLEQRRAMMQKWADYLDSIQKSET